MLRFLSQRSVRLSTLHSLRVLFSCFLSYVRVSVDLGFILGDLLCGGACGLTTFLMVLVRVCATHCRFSVVLWRISSFYSALLSSASDFSSLNLSYTALF